MFRLLCLAINSDGRAFGQKGSFSIQYQCLVSIWNFFFPATILLADRMCLWEVPVYYVSSHQRDVSSSRVTRVANVDSDTPFQFCNHLLCLWSRSKRCQLHVSRTTEEGGTHGWLFAERQVTHMGDSPPSPSYITYVAPRHCKIALDKKNQSFFATPYAAALTSRNTYPSPSRRSACLYRCISRDRAPTDRRTGNPLPVLTAIQLAYGHSFTAPCSAVIGALAGTGRRQVGGLASHFQS